MLTENNINIAIIYYSDNINKSHFTITAVQSGIFTPQWRAKFKEMSIHILYTEQKPFGRGCVP